MYPGSKYPCFGYEDASTVLLPVTSPLAREGNPAGKVTSSGDCSNKSNFDYSTFNVSRDLWFDQQNVLSHFVGFDLKKNEYFGD